MINLFEPIISKEAIKAVTSCLENNTINTGTIVKEFEEKLSSYIENKYVVAVNSCTSALHLALILAGVTKDDEVILPAQTFIATGTSVLMTGAKTVFADINLTDGTLLIEDVINKITSKTKAIIAVDWAGYPADLRSLKNVCIKYNIKLIEDAAQALGAEYSNYKIGSYQSPSDFTCFSLQAIKTITSGDGGFLVLNNEKDYLLAKQLRWFGVDKSIKQTNTEFTGRFLNVNMLGYKYNMNDITASIGLANFNYLDKLLEHSKNIISIYKNEITNNKIKFLNYNVNRNSSYWFIPILTENQLDLISYLREKRILVSVVDKGIDKNKLFNSNIDLPNQRIFENQHIGLPTHLGITEKQLNYIIDTINDY